MLGELAGDPAPAAEAASSALVLPAGTSAALADAPSSPAGLAAGVPSAAPACRGLARRAARLPEEKEAADLAAARACRGSPTSMVSESRMHGAGSRRAAKNKLANDGNSQGTCLLCVGQSQGVVSSERALDEQ